MHFLASPMCILRANRSRFYSLEGGLPILPKANKLHFTPTASTRGLSNQKPTIEIQPHPPNNVTHWGAIARRHPLLPPATLLLVAQARQRGTSSVWEAANVPFASRSWYLTWAHGQCWVNIWDGWEAVTSQDVAWRTPNEAKDCVEILDVPWETVGRRLVPMCSFLPWTMLLGFPASAL